MIKILQGDCRDVLKTLEDESVHCVVTSPPYFGLRDYGVADQIGLEPSPEDFVSELVAVFRDVRRVLRNDGTLWLNLGDSYASAWPCNRRNVIGNGSLQNGKREARPPRMGAGLKEKDLIGVPWMAAFALRADGWYLRQDIVWSKPNPMPESVRDRCTRSHEFVFMLSKSRVYFYDAEAIKEPAIYNGLANQDASGFKSPTSFNGKHKEGYRTNKQRGHGRRHEGFNARWDARVGTPRIGSARKELRSNIESRHRSSIPGGQSMQAEPTGTRNRRSVWTVATQPFFEAHFATFPPALIEPCILAGCPKGGTVLDPFGGAGTTGLVADRLERNAILIELNPEYAEMAKRRINNDAGMFADVEVA